jgi:hypothetical protein
MIKTINVVEVDKDGNIEITSFTVARKAKRHFIGLLHTHLEDADFEARSYGARLNYPLMREQSLKDGQFEHRHGMVYLIHSKVAA